MSRSRRDKKSQEKQLTMPVQLAKKPAHPMDLAFVKHVLHTIGRKPTPEECGLAEQVLIKAKAKYVWHRNQLYCLVLLVGGGLLQRPQEDFGMGEENVCSEQNTWIASSADPKEMASMVVAHVRHPKEKEKGGEPHIVLPCEMCRAEGIILCPHINVIFCYDGELWVLPIRALLPFPYGQVTGIDQLLEIAADDPVATALDDLVHAVGRKADDGEQGMAREAIIALERNYEHDPWERFFSMATTEDGGYVHGTRSKIQKGRYPCSCLTVFSRNSGSGAKLKKLVNAFIGADGKAHIGVVCESCRGRYLGRHDDIEVILEYKNELWALSLRVLVPFLYKERNGDGHQFTG
jgi:hypothetical protein